MSQFQYFHELVVVIDFIRKRLLQISYHCFFEVRCFLNLFVKHVERNYFRDAVFREIHVDHLEVDQLLNCGIHVDLNLAHVKRDSWDNVLNLDQTQ